MSPLTLSLSVVGVATVSTGIGVTIVNLSNTKNELQLLDEKIKELGRKIQDPSNRFLSKYQEISTRYHSLLTKISELTNDIGASNPTFKNPSDISGNKQKLKKIWKEIDNISKLLEKSKENSIQK